MVSSRDRLLSAAARAFAAHGYDGAGVDAIARAARLNKAMIYYHFGSKDGLYRAVVQDVFGAVLAVAGEVADTPVTPEEKLRRLVRGIAEIINSRPHFPALWIREFASGVPHLDERTLAVAARVVGAIGRILAEGERLGAFRRRSPLTVHIGIIAPLLLFAASAPMRQKLARAKVSEAGRLTLEQMIEHVTESTLAVLSRREGKTHA